MEGYVMSDLKMFYNLLASAAFPSTRATMHP